MEETKKRIPLAKRGKSLHKTDYTLKQSYKYYRKQIEKKSDYDRPYIEYARVCQAYNKWIVDQIYKGETVQFPHIGTLRIGKYRLRISKGYQKENKGKYQVDWGTSRKLDKIVYYTNEDRDGYKYAFKWRYAKRQFKNGSIYNFKPSMLIVRALAKKLKADPTMDFNEF